jgi:hypothetical protein
MSEGAKSPLPIETHFSDFILAYRLNEPKSRPNESSVCAEQESRHVDQAEDELPIGCLLSLDLLASHQTYWPNYEPTENCALRGHAYIRNTPNAVSGIGAFSAALSPSARYIRVSMGSMMPSSHRRAVL